MKLLSAILTFLLTVETLVAQNIELPEKISITEKSLSLIHTFYEYELELNGDDYLIQLKTFESNGMKYNGSKTIGTIDRNLIEDILLTITQPPTKEIQASDFENDFTLDLVNEFFKEVDGFYKEVGKNYWINTEQQKQFIIEELTNHDKLKNNLSLYFSDPNLEINSGGSSFEVKMNFQFTDTAFTISSKSILQVGLPLLLNDEKIFSPKLARQMGKVIPPDNTGISEQFEGKNLFSEVMDATIIKNSRILDSLGAMTYRIHIDSLINKFILSRPRVDRGTLSINWNGENRLVCTLRDSSMVSNVSISYSTTIENGRIKYPVSLITGEYRPLYSLVMNSEFFREYLAGHKKRQLSIIYDDNSCFTEKTKEFALRDCKRLKAIGSFDKAVFMSIKNEWGFSSRWVMLPNGQYFMWWNDGDPPKPNNDEYYLKCG